MPTFWNLLKISWKKSYVFNFTEINSVIHFRRTFTKLYTIKFKHVQILKSQFLIWEAVGWKCTVKKETLAQMFSRKFCEIFKNTFFYRTHLLAASNISKFMTRVSQYRVQLISISCKTGLFTFSGNWKKKIRFSSSEEQDQDVHYFTYMACYVLLIILHFLFCSKGHIWYFLAREIARSRDAWEFSKIFTVTIF